MSEIIRNSNAVLKPYWRCLQAFNETNDLMLEKILAEFDEKRQ